MRIFEHLTPSLGQGDGAAHPFEQRGAQFGFKLPDLEGDSGLGVAEGFCRPGEAVLFGYGNKGCQVFDVHGHCFLCDYIIEKFDARYYNNQFYRW